MIKKLANAPFSVVWIAAKVLRRSVVDEHGHDIGKQHAAAGARCSEREAMSVAAEVALGAVGPLATRYLTPISRVMPRPPPLKPISIPQVEREQRLSQLHDFASLLGFKTFPDGVADELARVFAFMRKTSSVVVGLTRKRQAAGLKKCAKKLRREQQTGRRNIKIRQLLADAPLDTETSLRLAPLTAAPTAELLAAVEACQRRLEQLPQINPQRQARESAGGAALWFFMTYAADSVRDEPGAWWDFVLAALDANGFPTAKLYEHPKDLRPLLDELRVKARPQADGVRDWLASGGTAEALLTLADKTEALLQDIARRGALRTDT